MTFCFQPYIERPKPTPYATWASVLLRTAPGLRTGLELELLLASTSGTRTVSTLDILVDLETLVGLLLLHSMHQSWSYAWVSCPHLTRWGKFVGTLRGYLGCDSPPKSVSKGARFWGFLSSRVRGVLGGIFSIPPFWTSFGGIKLGYGLLMRCSYYPQSLVQFCGAIRVIEVWFWGS
jgi:hypothetical protein